MAVNTTTLFTRLGRIWYGVQSANLSLGDTDISGGGLRAVGVVADRIQAQYTAADQNLIDTLYSSRDSARSGLDGWKSDLVTIAENTVVDMVNDDNPLVEKAIEPALIELIAQMTSASASVDASATSASVAYGKADGTSNTGDDHLVCSVYRTDGKLNELVLAEDIIVDCTTDAQVDQGATEGQEEWTFQGELTDTDDLAFDWPTGSSATGTLTAVASSAAVATDTPAENDQMLHNADIADFTSNIPDGWNVLVGTAGTTILKNVSTVYDSDVGAVLEFVGDGSSTLSSVAQTFSQSSTSTGSTADVLPSTVYHVSARMRKSASLAAGAISVSLIDGSNTQITDDEGNNVIITLAHGSIASNTWTKFGGQLVTPTNLPSTVKFRVAVSTALTNTESVYIGHISMTPATQAYDGGPYLSIHSGATASRRKDRATATIANDRAGAFQEAFDRMFDMKSLGLQLPSDSGGSETINDNLIA